MLKKYKEEMLNNKIEQAIEKNKQSLKLCIKSSEHDKYTVLKEAQKVAKPVNQEALSQIYQEFRAEDDTRRFRTLVNSGLTLILVGFLIGIYTYTH